MNLVRQGGTAGSRRPLRFIRPFCLLRNSRNSSKVRGLKAFGFLLRNLAAYAAMQFNTLAAIADRKAEFRSLVDTWADTMRRSGGAKGGDESLAEIGRTYNISAATISRLAAHR